MFKAGVAARQETGSGWAGQTLFLQVNGNGLSVPIRQGIGVWAADCPVLRPHRAWGPRGHCPQVSLRSLSKHTVPAGCTALRCGHCWGPRFGAPWWSAAAGWRLASRMAHRAEMSPHARLGWLHPYPCRGPGAPAPPLAGESGTFLSSQKGQLAWRHPCPPCPGAWASKRKPGVSR